MGNVDLSNLEIFLNSKIHEEDLQDAIDLYQIIKNEKLRTNIIECLYGIIERIVNELDTTYDKDDLKQSMAEKAIIMFDNYLKGRVFYRYFYPEMKKYALELINKEEKHVSLNTIDVISNNSLEDTCINDEYSKELYNKLLFYLSNSTNERNYNVFLSYFGIKTVQKTLTQISKKYKLPKEVLEKRIKTMQMLLYMQLDENDCFRPSEGILEQIITKDLYEQLLLKRKLWDINYYQFTDNFDSLSNAHESRLR